MRAIRIAGAWAAVLALACALAAGAYAAPTPEYGKCNKKATASGEGFADAGCTKHVATGAKYEWQGGADAGETFTTEIKPETKATLETKKKEKVVCTGETGFGMFLNNKEVEATPTFTGCSALTKACSTPGQPSGTIAVAALQGELGIEKIYINKETGKEEPAKNKLATNLYRQGNRGGEIVEFSCSGFVIKVKGTVLAPVPANKMLTSTTLKWAQSGGKQKPEKFEGGEKEVLESKFGEGAFEQSGQAVTVIQKGTPAVEASSVN